MFDIEDDSILNNHKVHWLIWIQILIMFLLTLIILLSYFGFFVVDSSSDSLTDFSSNLVNPCCSSSTQVAGNHGSRREIANTTSNRARCSDNNSEKDGSSTKDLAASNVSVRFFHPCRYFDLAKQAFLKCLGLGSSSLKEHEHED